MSKSLMDTSRAVLQRSEACSRKEYVRLLEQLGFRVRQKVDPSKVFIDLDLFRFRS